MDALYALAVAALVGAGVYGMLKRDLLRVTAGLALITYGVNLFLVAAGQSRGAAPVHPLPDGQPVSDPLVQALVLTAVVIGAATIAIVAGLVDRTFAEYRTLDQSAVSKNRKAG